jgi:hypothetical protein
MINSRRHRKRLYRDLPTNGSTTLSSLICRTYEHIGVCHSMRTSVIKLGFTEPQLCTEDQSQGPSASVQIRFTTSNTSYHNTNRAVAATTMLLIPTRNVLQVPLTSRWKFTLGEFDAAFELERYVCGFPDDNCPTNLKTTNKTLARSRGGSDWTFCITDRSGVLATQPPLQENYNRRFIRVEHFHCFLFLHRCRGETIHTYLYQKFDARKASSVTILQVGLTRFDEKYFIMG